MSVTIDMNNSGKNSKQCKISEYTTFLCFKHLVKQDFVKYILLCLFGFMSETFKQNMAKILASTVTYQKSNIR